MNNYEEALKKLRGTDLTKIGHIGYVDCTRLNSVQKDMLSNLGYDTTDYDCPVEMLHIAKCNIPDNVVTPGDGEFNEDEVYNALESLLGEALDGYLIYSDRCVWDEDDLLFAIKGKIVGSSGYMLLEEIWDTVARNVSIYPQGVSPQGKVLLCKEISPDAPEGGWSVIVALTEEEMEQLESADFESIKEYALKMVDKVTISV